MNQARQRNVKRRGKLPAFGAIAAASAASVGIAAPVDAQRYQASPAARSAASTEERIRDTNNQVYLDALAIQHLLRLAVAAIPTPTTAAEAAATVRASDMAITALDRCNRVRRVILRLDKGNHDADVVLPELPIVEMTELEAQAMRAQQERESGMSSGEIEALLEDHEDAEGEAHDGEVVEVGGVGS